MTRLILALWMSIGLSLAAEGDPPGHMQPLCSHRPPSGRVLELDHVPTSKEFFEKYMSQPTSEITNWRTNPPEDKMGVPFIMKGAAKTMPAYTKWQTDAQLGELYGDQEVQTEYAKVETRKAEQGISTLSKVLEEYNTTDVYSVGFVPAPMKWDIHLPKFLNCGGLNKRLAFNSMWFSAGGTKSVVHSDGYENVLCLFSGRKRFLIFSPKYLHEHPNIESKEMGWMDGGQDYSEHGYGAFSKIDVDKIDMKKMPGWGDLEYVETMVEAGDCLFLPSHWYHQVNSFGRNLAVNFWFHAAPRWEEQPCDDDHRFTLHNCSWLTPTWKTREKDFNLAEGDPAVYSACGSVEDVPNAGGEILQDEGGAGCEDDDARMKTASGGSVQNCAAAAELCEHEKHGELTRKFCPKTCGLCTEAGEGDGESRASDGSNDDVEYAEASVSPGGDDFFDFDGDDGSSDEADGEAPAEEDSRESPSERTPADPDGGGFYQSAEYDEWGEFGNGPNMRNEL